ncbi:FtsX-like permease family protein [Tissierella carlieri]|uniref:FtsX-like permease family protein n=1 Tax=Tissierella carlieri TaxID=689904 RepID=A0ABT1SFM6_9FIRM|nr:FtsX-like permease family protein [Tissierella carlieri]
MIFAIFGLILYNVVYFSILSDRKDLGIMTSLGMDKKVLYEIVTYRIVFYFVLAIPLGILSGVIVNNLLFEKFVAHFLGTESKQLLVDDFKVYVFY